MDPMLGQIIMFGGNFAPRGWALCDGQLLPVAQYSALFSILGTIYGGDGRTTFALPDLRGRVAMHAGHGPGLSDRRLGAKLGVEDVTLNITQIPSHTHISPTQTPTVSLPVNGSIKMPASSDEPTGGDPTGSILAESKIYSNAAPDAEMAAANHSLTAQGTISIPSANTNPTGGSQSHLNMQPSQVVNYIIALQGVFPSRS